MTDLSHTIGGDLSLSPSGDLAVVTGAAEGRQRVLRRILTLAGNYIWNLGYGGSAPELVGSLATPKQVEALMRAQMLKEASVAQSPPPVVKVSTIAHGLTVSIQYTDSGTSDPILLGFSVTT